MTVSRPQAMGVLGLLATGLLCNACCWLPALAVGLGGAAFSGWAHALEPWRPLLWAVAGVQLAWGFRSVYKPVGQCCHAHHGTHQRGDQERALRRMNIAVMWVVAAVVIAANAAPLFWHAPHH